MHVIKVSGMSCAHCVSAAEAAVLKVDAHAQVEVDLGAGEVRIDSNEATAPLRSAIEQAGYTVSRLRPVTQDGTEEGGEDLLCRL